MTERWYAQPKFDVPSWKYINTSRFSSRAPISEKDGLLALAEVCSLGALAATLRERWCSTGLSKPTGTWSSCLNYQANHILLGLWDNIQILTCLRLIIVTRMAGCEAASSDYLTHVVQEIWGSVFCLRSLQQDVNSNTGDKLSFFFFF